MKILVIPAGIIAGSLLGGVLCAFLVDWPLNEALSVAGGLGWYSLSGAAVSRLAGPELGSIAFLASLMREILAFFLIGVTARRANAYTAIAPAAATSEDTTLPMLIRYTNEETVVFAVVNGILCSAAVPVIIALCYCPFRDERRKAAAVSRQDHTIPVKIQKRTVKYRTDGLFIAPNLPSYGKFSSYLRLFYTQKFRH